MKTIPNEFRKGPFNFRLVSRTSGYVRNAAIYSRLTPRSDIPLGYDVFFIPVDNGEETLPTRHDYGRSAWRIDDQSAAWAKFASLERNQPKDTVDVPDKVVDAQRAKMGLDNTTTTL